MATLTQIRNAIDARLKSLWPVVQARQDAYFAAHGHYWQGLRTHTLHPADGNETLPDVGDKTPSDQPTAWPGTLIASPIPMSLQIDVYDGPRGKGYVATVRVGYNGKVYERAAQVGPETDWAHGWQIEPEVTA